MIGEEAGAEFVFFISNILRTEDSLLVRSGCEHLQIRLNLGAHRLAWCRYHHLSCARSYERLLLRLFADEDLGWRDVPCDIHPYWVDMLSSLLVRDGSPSHAEGCEIYATHM